MDEKNKSNGNTDGDVPFFTSYRFLIAVLGFLGSMCTFLNTSNMGIAIVCMTVDVNTTVSNSSQTGQSFDSTNCGHDIVGEGSKRGEFEWDRPTRGNVLSGMYWGFLASTLTGGIIADKLGAKWVLVAAHVLVSGGSFFVPLASRAGSGWIIALQVIRGIGGGMTVPAFTSLIGKWAPEFERTKLSMIVTSGMPMGTLLSFLLAGILCDVGYAGGWPSIFYTFGAAGCLWMISWVFLGYSSPADHPWISSAERNYIEESLGVQEQEKKESHSIPVLSLITSLPVWAILFAAITESFAGYFSFTAIPQYMHDVLKFDMSQNGLYNALPQLAMWLGANIAGPLSDFVRNKKIVSTVVVRKVALSWAFLPPGVFSIIIGYLTCEQSAGAVALLVLSGLFLGITASGCYVNILDIAPRYAGVIMGMAQTVGSITGICVPLISNALTSEGEQWQWQRMFFIVAGIYLFGLVAFIILGRGTEQKWARDPSLLDNVEVEIKEKDLLSDGSESSAKIIKPSLSDDTEKIEQEKSDHSWSYSNGALQVESDIIIDVTRL